MRRYAQQEPQEVYTEEQYNIPKMVETMNRAVRLDTIIEKPWLAHAKQTEEKKKNREI